MNLPKLKKFARRYWIQLSAFILSAGFALFFGLTFMADAIYFNDPRHKDGALKNWMTPRYIVLSYDLPHEFVVDTLGITEEERGTRPRMKDIAERMDITLDELTTKVREAAKTYRETEK